MKIEILDNPDQSFIDFLDKQLAEFNWAHWEVNERKPLGVQLKDSSGKVIAGCSGRTFGNWLQIATLWVAEEARGKNVGRQILLEMEAAAIKRGCVKSILDTLNFQAMPFYKKYGYVTQWVQQEYPKTGCKYYMVKSLKSD